MTVLDIGPAAGQARGAGTPDRMTPKFVRVAVGVKPKKDRVSAGWR
jgi:hypothetical protein